MTLPAMLVTGASGFVGRHVLDAFRERYRIFALARRSQARAGVPCHPNITWFQADIADFHALETVFAAVREAGGAEVLIHLAAHYDFTGQPYVEYWRTNVHGMRNVLQLAQGLPLRRFVFPGSLAACRFPRPGTSLDESSPADAHHIYAQTKRLGEEMLVEFGERVPSTVVRFAAMFSDWCEYPPLFMFLSTWLARVWNRRILAGRGLSAITYLQVRDAMVFLGTLLDRLDSVPPGELLIASPDGAVSHRELFEAASLAFYGRRPKPILMPKLLCAAGIEMRDLLGRLLGERPFERPWMISYIDHRMRVDARRTRARLGWEPRARLEILRRMPFLVENLRSDPIEWNRRNRAALKKIRLETNLRIYALLKKHAHDIALEFTEALHGPEGRRRFPAWQEGLTGEEQLRNHHHLLLRHLMDAIRTGEKAVIVSYCRDLAERRFEQGFEAREVCDALQELNRICFKVLHRDAEWEALRSDIRDQITASLAWGCDEVQEVFEHLEAGRPREGPGP